MSPDQRPPLTRRQARILDTIRASVAGRGYPPTLREVGDAVGLSSSSSVAHQITVLEARGYIARDPNRPRALVILDDPAQTPDAELRAAARELINASLGAITSPQIPEAQLVQAQAWDQFALALDAAEDAHR